MPPPAGCGPLCPTWPTAFSRSPTTALHWSAWRSCSPCWRSSPGPTCASRARNNSSAGSSRASRRRSHRPRAHRHRPHHRRQPARSARAASRRRLLAEQEIPRRGRAAERARRRSLRVGKRTKLDPTLILAIMAVESSFNPFAQSHVGAQGLMQVMTRVHGDKYESAGGTLTAFDPVTNMRVGVKVLQECIARAGSLEGGLRYYVGAANLRGRRRLCGQGAGRTRAPAPGRRRPHPCRRLRRCARAADPGARAGQARGSCFAKVALLASEVACGDSGADAGDRLGYTRPARDWR